MRNVVTKWDHDCTVWPRDRCEALFDGGVFVEVGVPEPVADAQQFRDQKK